VKQSKNLNELGPFFAYPEFSDGVMFSTFDTDNEYIDARAYRAYEQYQPAEYIKPTLFTGIDTEELREIRKTVDAYTNELIKAYITGEKDPFDDGDWENSVSRYKSIGAGKLADSVQVAYDLMEK
jgi:hypothetical protein